MKLKENFEIVRVDDTVVIVPINDAEFKGIVKLNRSAAFIVGCLSEDTAYEEILEKLKNKYDVPEDTLKAAIDKTLLQLRSINALCE